MTRKKLKTKTKTKIRKRKNKSKNRHTKKIGGMAMMKSIASSKLSSKVSGMKDLAGKGSGFAGNNFPKFKQTPDKQ